MDMLLLRSWSIGHYTIDPCPENLVKQTSNEWWYREIFFKGFFQIFQTETGTFASRTIPTHFLMPQCGFLHSCGKPSVVCMKLWWMAFNQVATLNAAQTKPKQSKGTNRTKTIALNSNGRLGFCCDLCSGKKKYPGGYRYSSFQKEKTTVEIRYHY